MKLFVVVRTDLTPPQSAVQAGHAVAEYMTRNDDWRNETLVYLAAKDEHQLADVSQRLKHKGVKHCSFFEPDLGGELTAISSTEKCSIFSKLPLL